MSTFGLIHGGAADSTHWRLLVPELEQRGHRVLLVDLPMSDPKSPTPASRSSRLATQWAAQSPFS
jgi:pimeloyl-ACP methyl ester carboxylesterase